MADLRHPSRACGDPPLPDLAARELDALIAALDRYQPVAAALGQVRDTTLARPGWDSEPVLLDLLARVSAMLYLGLVDEPAIAWEPGGAVERCEALLDLVDRMREKVPAPADVGVTA